MFNLSSFVQKAQSAAQQLIDPMQGLNLTNSDRHPSKASLFQNQFRLPSSQTPRRLTLADLDDDVLLELLGFLDLRTVLNLRQVSSQCQLTALADASCSVDLSPPPQVVDCARGLVRDAEIPRLSIS